MNDVRPPAEFAQAFDAAIRERGVTLTHLHRRLTALATPVSVATLSYWRSGRSVPERQTSLAAVSVLEELLAVGDGNLADHLRPVRRPGPSVPAVPIEELTGNAEAVRRALAQLGFETVHDELAADAVALRMDVDEHGGARRVSSLVRWRALRDGAQRVAVVFTTEDPDENAPVLTPIAGVDLGRTYSDPPHQVHVSELVLERPLAQGEIGFGEYEVAVDGADRQGSSLAYYAPRRVPQVLVWARFHADCLPERVEAFDVYDGQEVARPMTLGGGRSLHRRASRYGPGTMGIRWAW